MSSRNSVGPDPNPQNFRSVVMKALKMMVKMMFLIVGLARADNRSCVKAPSSYEPEDFRTVTPMNTQCVAPHAGLSRAEACPRTQWTTNGVYNFVANRTTRCRRHIYFDLGANAWASSLEWAVTKYPIRFDEAHAWEMSRQHFPRIPANQHTVPPLVMLYNAAADDHENCRPPCAIYRRLSASSHCAGDACEKKQRLLRQFGCCRAIHIAKYLKAVATPEDFVLFKIDVEGMEYKIFDDLINTGAWTLIDEVLAEFHFVSKSPGLDGWGRPGGPAWRSYKSKAMTFQDAVKLVDDWRSHRIPAFHVWA